MSLYDNLKKELKGLENPEKAKILSRFFKTGLGEYGEGDIFLGISVPKQRIVSKKYIDLTLKEISELLKSEIHEYRFVSLLILIEKYNESNEIQKKEIFEFYVKNINSVNNWDLVDLSAPKILGDYLIRNIEKRDILYEFARSYTFWVRRTSIVSCFAFIKNNDFQDALNISEILIKDKEDLIHKAVGWMLREIGKRNLNIEEKFLKKNNNYKNMPRTMLRYSIERFNKEKKYFYMKK